jgi:hypothetical protein
MNKNYDSKKNPVFLFQNQNLLIKLFIFIEIQAPS